MTTTQSFAREHILGKSIKSVENGLKYSVDITNELKCTINPVFLRKLEHRS